MTNGTNERVAYANEHLARSIINLAFAHDVLKSILENAWDGGELDRSHLEESLLEVIEFAQGAMHEAQILKDLITAEVL